MIVKKIIEQKDSERKATEALPLDNFLIGLPTPRKISMRARSDYQYVCSVLNPYTERLYDTTRQDKTSVACRLTSRPVWSRLAV